MTEYFLPSPLAQNEIAFLDAKFAGAIICLPGQKSAPAQRGGFLSMIVPVSRSDPLLPLAPPFARPNFTVDVPPRTLSVDSIQPSPKVDFGMEPSGPSKSLT